jgi:hypothetical protein
VHNIVTQPNGSIIMTAMHLLLELAVLQDAPREHRPVESTVDSVMVVNIPCIPTKWLTLAFSRPKPTVEPAYIHSSRFATLFIATLPS